MAYEKKKIKDGRPDPKDKKKYTIEAGGENEEDIIIVFKSDADADRAKKVDKLNTDGLPASGDRVTGIIWINSFWLKKGNGQYLNDMPYYVQLRMQNGKTLVTYDGSRVKRYSGETTDLGNGWIQIELNFGDPGTGWGSGT